MRIRHPDPLGVRDCRPVVVGETWDNPVNGERVTILELPSQNPEGRVTFELLALVGARVAGEHHHPCLVERFEVIEGELALKRDGKTTMLREGHKATIEPMVWHDWWNPGDCDARVLVQITPGQRFMHLIENFFGLARSGHTNADGLPNLLQLALIAREFRDVIVLRRPPELLQRVLFGALGSVAHWRGYRATYPQFSRSALMTHE